VYWYRHGRRGDFRSALKICFICSEQKNGAGYPAPFFFMGLHCLAGPNESTATNVTIRSCNDFLTSE
jgi:hypothetical protein